MTATQHTKTSFSSSVTRNATQLLLAVLFIAVVPFLIFTNLKLVKTVRILSSDCITLKQQQTDTKAQFDSILERQDSKQSKLNEKMDILSKHLAQALQERWYQKTDWILLKARYYMELAEINAHWSDDMQITSALLQQSDNLLVNIHDPELFVVRQAIAQELAQLQTIPQLDVVGLLAKLDAAQQLIADLPVKNPFSLTESNLTAEETTPTSTSWHAHLQNSIKLLEKLVVIRHHDEAIQPLIAPEYESLLKESISLNLQEAQWAVIQRHHDIYNLSLVQAISTIKRAFDLKAANTQSLLQQLDALQQIQLNSQKPNTGESLLRLNQLIESKKSESTPNVSAPASGDQS